ncbi:MAG: hypothetical protein WCW31_05910 [Patescibacteria group bacterium]
MHLAWYIYLIIAVLWLFIGNLVRRASISRWKAETNTVRDGIAGLNWVTYEVRNKPTIGFWLLFPSAAYYRNTGLYGNDEPMVSEIDDPTAAIWYCGLLLLFWPMKIILNLLILFAIFLWSLPQILGPRASHS